jgi:hypothetical protein
MAFDFDLFISYSHLDAEWARRLFDDLKSGGLDPTSIYFDDERIEPGAVWRPGLEDAVLKTRQLAVLWSKNAKDSDWVINEVTKFDLTMKRDASRQPLDGQRLLFIPLDEQNRVYDNYQLIDDIRKANAYPGNVAAVDPNVWSSVVEKVIKSVTANADFKPIRLVVLAMTRDRINSLNLETELPDNASLPGNSKLSDAIRLMGITMQIGLLDRLDPALTIPGGTRLDAALTALGFMTEPNPEHPGEIRALLPSGEPFGAALARRGLTTMDDLLKWLDANPAVALPNGQALNAALTAWGMRVMPHVENLMIKVALRQYYGEGPLDWRPFGSPVDKISTILSKVKAKFNRRLWDRGLPDKRFRWQLAGDFWTPNDPDAEEELNKLVTKRAVIVVDPLSLYEGVVNHRFTRLFDAFGNEHALFMAFAPFALPTPTGVMRTLINDKAVKLFTSFYEPRLVAERTIATCGPDVGDQADISRWLLTALWPAAATSAGARSSASEEAAAIMRPTG